jgi:hypothetical protein
MKYLSIKKMVNNSKALKIGLIISLAIGLLIMCPLFIVIIPFVIARKIINDLTEVNNKSKKKKYSYDYVTPKTKWNNFDLDYDSWKNLGDNYGK